MIHMKMSGCVIDTHLFFQPLEIAQYEKGGGQLAWTSGEGRDLLFALVNPRPMRDSKMLEGWGPYACRRSAEGEISVHIDKSGHIGVA